MSLAPRVARCIAWTRLQAACLDIVAGALAGAGLGAAAGHTRAGAFAGGLAGALAARRWTPMRAAKAIERGRPALGSALEAYLEGQGGGLRPLLAAWVADRVGPVWLHASWFRLALAAAVAVGGVLLPRPAPRSTPAIAARPAQLPALSVTARVVPPPYAGRPTVEVTGPHLSALRGSTVELHVQSRAARVTWAEQDGVEHPLELSGGRTTFTLLLDRSRSLRLATGAGGPVVLLELEAVPDTPPLVTLVAPDADRTVTSAPSRFSLHASARDDVAVLRMGFRWTLAQGQGESMHFRSGAVPARMTVTERVAEAAASLDPGALGMNAGDTLVVWADATDGNTVDGPGEGRSEARIVRWVEAVVDLTGSATAARLPPPKSLLTERELLARTERLVHSGVGGAALRARSSDLAADQRQIRETFGFFLQMERQDGLELDVDDKELGESGDARARKLLAQAVSEMWAAEAELSAVNPRGAIPPMRAAVKALDAAFGNERMSLRALRPPDKPVDESRRLSGKQTELRPQASVASVSERPETHRVGVLARRLLLSAEQGMSPEVARALADAVWTLPATTGIPAPALAGPLYAANDPASRGMAARAAAASLARWLRPSPVVVPPVSPDEGAVLTRVPLPPAPR